VLTVGNLGDHLIDTTRVTYSPCSVVNVTLVKHTPIVVRERSQQTPRL
jgi:hypothetical protein